jgi:glutamate dehydrogenase (NADP+)
MNPQEIHHGLEFLDDLRQKYSHQPTFLQSVEEIALSLLPLFEEPAQGDFYKRAFVAMTEPERTIFFRVPWEDDNGNLQFNRGWRVEFSRFVCTLQESSEVSSSVEGML